MQGLRSLKHLFLCAKLGQWCYVLWSYFFWCDLYEFSLSFRVSLWGSLRLQIAHHTKYTPTNCVLLLTVVSLYKLNMQKKFLSGGLFFQKWNSMIWFQPWFLELYKLNVQKKCLSGVLFFFRNEIPWFNFKHGFFK